MPPFRPPSEPHREPWHGTAEDAARLLHGRDGLAWIDSSEAGGPRSRWSIVASDPRWRLVAYGEDVLFDGPAGPQRLAPGALNALVDQIDAETPVAPALGDLPFVGGAIGYLGFELAREVESLPCTTVDDVGAPDLAFAWYDAALVEDHSEGRSWLVGRSDAVQSLRRALETAQPQPVEPPSTGSSLLRSNMTRDRYLAAVERARDYIRAGDIYQVNLSQRFSTLCSRDGFEVYRTLREVSPAPFAAYLDLRGELASLELLSSSPERFLLANGSHLETRPIKGTRPRGASEAEDRGLAEALRASEKDRAEHVMIVDLERNDLGRVALPGSVAVPEFAALESFRQVHHLTSTITARRRPGTGLRELLRATFPGGSITGAPKIRALEIIDELEPTVRGVYTGAIGYVSATGRLDLNIAIRTITLADGVAHLHVGGAIVHDSDPEAEYVETLDKARGMARALAIALPDESSEVLDRPAATGSLTSR
jgi:para-aminobenzoate synthetase component 1